MRGFGLGLQLGTTTQGGGAAAGPTLGSPINTGFSDTWTDTSGGDWTLAAGSASSADVADDLRKPLLTIGVTYKVDFTLVGLGPVSFHAGDTEGTTRDDTGTYSEDILCTGATMAIFHPIGGFQGTISDLVITPYL